MLSIRLYALALTVIMMSCSILAATDFPAADKPSAKVESSKSEASNSESSTGSSLPKQVETIDRMLATHWEAFELKPSPECSDDAWCRRVYLDIIGRIPTVKELDQFVSSKAADKKQKLVEMLLYDDDYTEEYTRNWTTIWTNLLIGRSGGNNNQSMISREGMQKYLRDSFARNKPYDRFVKELITATGTTTPGTDEFNGATNFLIDKVNEENAAQATAATSKLFLGLQVQCTQCHNHPFNEWKQQKYWEFNAFFRQVRAFRGGMRGSMAPATLADQDFRGEGPSSLDNAAVFYRMRNERVKAAYPVFVDGTEIGNSGYVNVTNRRKELARLVVDSPFFGQVAVNRMWGHFLGYGFTQPIDDLGPHNVPSNPELLEYLATEFHDSEFNVRRLISWIVLSKAYGLESKRTKSNQQDDPLLGEAPRFSHFYLRQMRAEELYESLMVATEARSGMTYEAQEQRKNVWLRQFTTAFGTDEGDEATTFNGSIPQVLMMFNGDLIKAATRGGQGSMISRLAGQRKLKYEDKVTYLFKAGLSRRPKREELKIANQFLAARNKNEQEALEDVWWVVLNSNEFIFNH